MKMLGDEKIRYKLEAIQPEGFDWADVTKADMIKFKAIAQLQLQDVVDEMQSTCPHNNTRCPKVDCCWCMRELLEALRHLRS